jgi:hypothetical protein
MDPVIWGNLPQELVFKILECARENLSIDARLAFRLKPKKIPETRAWKIWYLLNNSGIFYNIDSRTLHNFRVPGAHIIRRPVDMVAVSEDLTVFNMNGEEHSLEITTSTGLYLCRPGQTEPVATEFRVILKGGGFIQFAS